MILMNISMTFSRLNGFINDALKLYYYLTDANGEIPNHIYYVDMMNRSLAHCHVMLSVKAIVDPLFSSNPMYRRGSITWEFLHVIKSANETSFKHMLQMDATRTKILEIYEKSPSDFDDIDESKVFLIREASERQQEVARMCLR